MTILLSSYIFLYHIFYKNITWSYWFKIMSDNIDRNLTTSGIIKNTFWVYFITFLIAPMQYIVRILIAKHLPVEEVWLVYAMIWLTGILAIYNDLGFREAIWYFYPRYLARKDYNKSKTILISTLIIQLVSSCILSSLLIHFSDSIAIHYLKYPDASFIIKIFGWYLFFYILYSFIDNIFLLYQNAFINKVISLINQISLIVFVFLVPYGVFTAIWVKSDLSWYVIAHIFPSIIGIIIWIFIFMKKYKSIALQWEFHRDAQEYKKVQKYALGVLVTNNIIYLLSSIDIQIATFLFGTTKSWLYSYGMMLTNLFITLLSPIGWLLYPMVSHLKARNYDGMMKRVFYAIVNYMWVIAMVWSIYVFMYSEQIMWFLFGINYIDAGNIVKRNLLFVTFGVLSGIIFIIYAWLGLIKKRLKMLIVVFILNVLWNFLLSNRLGINGIALTMWITWMALFIYWYIDLIREGVELQINYKLFLKNIIISIIAISIIYYFYRDLWSNNIDIIKWIAISWFLYIFVIAIVNITIIKNAGIIIRQLIKSQKNITN